MSREVFGRSVPRLEDQPLITGRGRFVDDITLDGMLHASFVRSPLAHARIAAVDSAAARALPGVHAVFTLDDFRPHLVRHRLIVGLPSPAYRQEVDRPALADGEVVHVGEPVAVVIADDRYIAEDAAAVVDVAYDPLAVVADPRAALEADAPTAHRGAPHNLLAEFTLDYGDVDTALSTAPHLFRESIWQHRGGSHSLECRGGVAWYDTAEDKLTLWSSTQAPHMAMRILSDMLGWNETRLRVVIPDVGGGFGPKIVFYPEDVSIALSAILLQRPVKWIEDRREHFVATTQERDQYWEVGIALDDDARILGIAGTMIHDHGAYTARGINLAYNSAMIVPLPYEVPAYRLEVKLALTNKVPVTPVRGAGHPQGAFVMERLLDRAARELGVDRAEIRRRNLIPGEKMPYRKQLKTRSDTPVVLDSGDYLAAMDMALERVGYGTFCERQRAARAEGRYIGIGLANYVKGTGRGPFETVTVRIGKSGRILVYSGAAAMGQSTRTMLAQVVADQLGNDMGNVDVVVGDTDTVPLGIGGSASRQTVTAGSSARLAAAAVREKALKVAAQMLEASEQDLEIDGSEIRVKGVPELKVTLGQAATAVAGTPGFALPAGIEPGMEATESLVVDDLTFANGTQVVAVEVDIETGKVSFLDYVMIHDSGTIINPMIVDGQVVGGIAHGVGNALFEWMGFDETGQPLTTSLAEYLMVTATEMPAISLGHMISPTPLNPLGAKGVGECGLVPASAAIAAAIEDALSPFGVRIAQVPITPAEIVARIAQGRLSAEQTAA